MAAHRDRKAHLFVNPCIPIRQVVHLFKIAITNPKWSGFIHLLTLSWADFYYLPRTAGMAYGLCRGIAVSQLLMYDEERSFCD
jgi:hypothetical protein